MLIRAFATFLLLLISGLVPNLRAELTPAEALLQEGRAALEAGDPKGAAVKFEEIFAKYPTFVSIDDTRVLLGVSYLLDNQFQKSIDNLAKVMGPPASDSVRERALYFTAISQLQIAYAAKNEDPKRKSLFETSIASFSKHVKEFTGKSDNTEQVLYNRALAEFTIDDYDGAQKDTEQLVADYASSLDRVYYLSLLGSIHCTRTVKLMNDKKTEAEILASADKAFTAFKQIGTDPASLIASNEAQFQSAQLRLRLAIVNEAQKENLTREALQNFRAVRSREELVPLLDKRIASLLLEVRDAAQKQDARRRERAEGQREREVVRLDRLKQGTDPSVTAALGAAQCFSRLKRYDEARVLLHRVLKYADTDSKKSASFELILTYAFQGNAEKTNAALDEYQKNYAKDQAAASIGVIVGNELRSRGNYAEALNQYERNLKDFPTGEYAEQATVGRASALVGLKRFADAVGTLEKFTNEKKDSPLYPGALFDLAQTYENQGKVDEAVRSYRTLSGAPKASPELQARAAYQAAEILFAAKRTDDAVHEFQGFLTRFPTTEYAPFASLRIGNCYQAAGKAEDALKAYAETLTKFADHPRVGPGAQAFTAAIYLSQSKFPEMIEAYQKLITKYPTSDQVPIARARLASHYERGRKIEEAAVQYEALATLPGFAQASSARLALSKLYYDNAISLGNFSALKDDEKKQFKDSLIKASENAVRVLQEFPASFEANGALQRLIDITSNKNKAGLLTETPDKAFLAATASLTDPVMKNRLQIASAAFAFEKGDKTAALAVYKGVLAADSKTPLTPEDYNRYGLCLIDAKDMDGALAAGAALQEAYPSDQRAQANAAYLLGAAWQAKGDTSKADTFFTKLEKDYPWSDRIFEAKLGRGKAAAGRGASDDALKLFREVIMSPRSTNEQKATSLLGSGEVLEKDNKLVPEKGPDGKVLDKPNAAGFYRKANDFYGDSNPEIGVEALFRAGKLFEKAGQPAEARKIYTELTTKKAYKDFPQNAQAAERLKALPAQ